MLGSFPLWLSVLFVFVCFRFQCLPSCWLVHPFSSFGLFLGILCHVSTLAIFQQVFPAGVVNVISGDGKVILGPILQSGKLDVFAFIGSSRVADVLQKVRQSVNINTLARSPLPYHCVQACLSSLSLSLSASPSSFDSPSLSDWHCVLLCCALCSICCCLLFVSFINLYVV